jgi:predicted DNA-binding protein (MmcQ/YjbR family)
VIPGRLPYPEMNIETLRELCRSLPAVTEDVKWGHDLCFSVAGKMFCVAALDGPLTVSFKVKDDEFDELSNSPGLRPAPYVARYKWVPGRRRQHTQSQGMGPLRQTVLRVSEGQAAEEIGAATRALITFH